MPIATTTISITGTPTGSKLVITYTADKVYTVTLGNAVSTHATLAEVQTALETIFGTGNVAVTGTAGTTYTCTFQNALDKVQVDGTFAVTATFTAGSGPAVAWARTTQGSAGPGQYVAYDDAGSNGAATAKAILARAYLSDPVGGYVSEYGPTSQPFSPPVYVSGYFLCSDLTGLDANGATDLGKLVVGNAYSDTGAVLKM